MISSIDEYNLFYFCFLVGVTGATLSHQYRCASRERIRTRGKYVREIDRKGKQIDRWRINWGKLVSILTIYVPFKLAAMYRVLCIVDTTKRLQIQAYTDYVNELQPKY